MISFKGRQFQKEMILQSFRWYLACSLSYRDIEEMMKERGFEVDHSTVQRWGTLTFHPFFDGQIGERFKRWGIS